MCSRNAIYAIVLIFLFLSATSMPVNATGNETKPIVDGKFKLAVVYLYHNVPYDSRIFTTIQNVMNVGTSLNNNNLIHYSVREFYQKYGINIISTFQSYPIGVLSNEDATGDELDNLMISKWIVDNPTVSKQLYDSSDGFAFFLAGNQPHSCATSGLFVYGIWNTFETNPWWNRDTAEIGYVAAHEIGHMFGARGHYIGEPGGNPINDARCVMNEGGDGLGHLTKGGNIDTIFGTVDLADELHFSYVERVPYESMKIFGSGSTTIIENGDWFNMTIVEFWNIARWICFGIGGVLMAWALWKPQFRIAKIATGIGFFILGNWGWMLYVP
jgi:hypothetical protein